MLKIVISPCLTLSHISTLTNDIRLYGWGGTKTFNSQINIFLLWLVSSIQHRKEETFNFYYFSTMWKKGCALLSFFGPGQQKQSCCVYYTDQSAVNMQYACSWVSFFSLCHKCVTDWQTEWPILQFQERKFHTKGGFKTGRISTLFFN